ncbi:MAG: hypothetical protein KDA66_20745, partial [Planctomycetaceae bacterium]|nr:hypothetical protein [Planctomycetaceae bacterium]
EEALRTESDDDKNALQFELPTGVTLREALDFSIDEQPLQLDYVVRFDMLDLTTRTQAEEVLETVVYELRDLPKEAVEEWWNMANLIQSHVDGWLDDGTGDGSLSSFPGGVSISQTQRRHREILELLIRLREFNTGPPLNITVADGPVPERRGERLPPGERRIQAALDGPPPENIERVSNLREFSSMLRDSYEFPVKFDELALRSEGVSPTTEFRVRKLNSLRNMLRYANTRLEWDEVVIYVDESTLKISTRERANDDLSTKFYDMDGLAAGIRSDDIFISDMVLNISDESWLDNGTGSGVVTIFPGCLVISCNATSHENVHDLFEQLREFSAQQGYPEPAFPALPEFDYSGQPMNCF